MEKVEHLRSNFWGKSRLQKSLLKGLMGGWKECFKAVLIGLIFFRTTVHLKVLNAVQNQSETLIG